MKDIVIIGAGGFGREVAWLIEDINKVNLEWNIIFLTLKKVFVREGINSENAATMEPFKGSIR